MHSIQTITTICSGTNRGLCHALGNATRWHHPPHTCTVLKSPGLGNTAESGRCAAADDILAAIPRGELKRRLARTAAEMGQDTAPFCERRVI